VVKLSKATKGIHPTEHKTITTKDQKKNEIEKRPGKLSFQRSEGNQLAINNPHKSISFAQAL
jgi:hypothetical protein